MKNYRPGDKYFKKLSQFLILGFLLASQVSDANELESKIKSAFEEGSLSGLHSVLVYHKGKIVAENYFQGRDYKFSNSLGNRRFSAESLHDIRSITKNITSLLYGIALSEGLVENPDSILVDQFPYQDLKTDPARRKILVHHALAMTMGTEWDESVPYTSTENDEIAMESAPDRYRYVLDRPLVSEPGEVWNYNGGAPTLIGQMISKGVGIPIDLYAKERLFFPLGITNYEWLTGSDGTPSTAAGLRLTNHDLAKIGLMMLNNGKYNGKQIVPESWIAESMIQRSVRTRSWQYGYLWWLSPADIEPTSYDGFGNGGQRLYISSQAKIVIVIFAGNYNIKGAWKVPDKLINEIIIPSLYKSE